MSSIDKSVSDTLVNDIQAMDINQGTTDTYDYSPLQPRHIRLFRVTHFGHEIFCEMEHFPLQACPDYHALSYAWGPGLFDHRIFFTGNKHHLITKHLHQGLASTISLLSPRWLWVDQICINQRDDKDKAEQVALMGDIYTNAVQTVVWLGPAYEKSDLAMSHAQGIAELIRNYEFDTNLATLPPVELGFPHEDEQVWPAFQYLFRRSWWKRLWIIQEAIKARDIVFVVGNQLASYADFLTLASAHEKLIRLIPDGTYKLGILSGLSKAFYTLRNDVLLTIGRVRSGEYARVDEGMSQSNATQFIGNVVTILEFSRNQLCTEPVDRVYVILGLVSKQVANKIRIDYSLKNREEYWRAYLDFYRHLIDTFLDAGYLFTVLVAGQHKSDTPKSLPSWCPDLTNSKRMACPNFVEAATANIPSSATWKPDYRMIEPCNSNPSILHVTGVQVDSIKTLVPLWSAPTSVRFDRFTCRDATDVKTPLIACFKLAEAMRLSPEDFKWMDVLFRTLVMNTRAFSGDPYPADELGTDFLAFLDRLTAIIDHQHHGKEFSATEVSEKASRYASAFFEYTRGRAIFTTTGGRLGMCDATAVVGDEVAVWFNCPFPVVQRVQPGVGGCLTPPSDSSGVERIKDTGETIVPTWLPGKFPGERREQQHRKLVSLCYVDGLMRGEIFKERDMAVTGYSNFLIV